MTTLDTNVDAVAYPLWDELPGDVLRDWALFFGQDISAQQVINPAMHIISEFEEEVPMGMQRNFTDDSLAECAPMFAAVRHVDGPTASALP